MTSSTQQGTISSVQNENRTFPPSKEFSEKAHIPSAKKLESISKKAAKNPVEFWEKQAESLEWFRKWNSAYKWKHPIAEWFGGGKINISYNCLDRHLNTWRRNKAALIWEGEPDGGEIRTLTY